MISIFASVALFLLQIALLAATRVQEQSLPPNLLLLFPDEWRWDWQSSGVGVSSADTVIDVHTPNFDKIAAAGTAFAHAYVASPLCAPSRAALALGREYDTQQVPSNSFDVPENLVTHYRALRDVGNYHVMVSGKDDLTKHSGYGPDGSYRASQLGYSAWQGRTPGKAGTLKSKSGPFPGFLANQTVTLPNGTKADALWVHDQCFGKTSLVHKLKYSALTCCLPNKTLVCSTPVLLPFGMYEDNWVGEHALRMLKQRPPGKPWFMQVVFVQEEGNGEV